MKIIGITGGIAAGKSTVTRWLQSAGFSVVLADEVVKDLLAPQTLGYKYYLKALGAVTLPSGELDRVRIREILTQKPRLRHRLQKYLWPRVAAAAYARIQTLKTDKPFIFYENALLFESGVPAWVDDTLCVYANNQVRLRRLLARDGMTTKSAQAFMKLQRSQSWKKDRSRWTLANNGTPQELVPNLLTLLDKIYQHYQIPPTHKANMKKNPPG